MKALTISQPYASLIASGDKFVENRNWPTSYRGPLAIHAGKGSQYLTREELRQYPTGCVIAIATLAACVPLSFIEQFANSIHTHRKPIPCSNRSWQEAAAHEHTEGPYCWILDNVRPIDPFECRGAQGLWNIELPASVERKVRR